MNDNATIAGKILTTPLLPERSARATLGQLESPLSYVYQAAWSATRRSRRSGV